MVSDDDDVDEWLMMIVMLMVGLWAKLWVVVVVNCVDGTTWWYVLMARI